MDESPVPSTLPPGTRIRDYVIEEFIAAGGFGSVYRVRDHRPGEDDNGRVAAMKVLHPELQSVGDAFVRFLREADVLERIRHRNIIEVYDSGSLNDGRAFVVTEFLSGRDLDERIELDGPLDPRQCVAILRPVCEALTCAHANRVIHRDVKASNVFLSERDGERRVVLLDFGLAKIIEANGLDLTSSRLSLGTPASMAPEQIRGEDIDPRTDIYALGGLLYHMLTGKLPFDDQSRTVMQYMHLHGQRPRASSRANVGPALDEVVARAMAPDRRDRFAAPDEFLSALQRATGPRPALTGSGSPGEPPANPDSNPDAESDTHGQLSDGDQAVAIYVDIRITRGAERDLALDDPDDDDVLFSAVDDILAATDSLLDARGFQRAIEESSATLFVRLLAAESAARLAGWRDAATTALELQRAIADMAHDDIHVNLCLHAGPAQVRDGRIQGGDVLRVERWAPGEQVTGVAIAAPGVPSDGALVTEPVARRSDVVRLLAVVAPPRRPGKDTSERAMHTEMMANIGRQVASIVHDLRSPLAVVLGNLEVVLDNARRGKPLDDDDCEAIEDAMRAARQLMETSAGLMEASAVRTYSAATRRAIPVPDLIDHAVRLARGSIRQRAQLEVRHDAPQPILGSPGRLTQVLINLLINAAQAIPDDRAPGGGHITVHTETVPGARAPGRVRLTIRDNGVGMERAVKDRIFEPYFTTKDVGEGTGLGLSLVREIIEQHRGSIAVESRPGAGSCFIIELPAAPPEALPADPQIAEQTPSEGDAPSQK